MILERLLKHQLPSDTHMLLLVLVAGIVTFSPLLLGSVSHDLFRRMEKIDEQQTKRKLASAFHVP